MPRGIFFVAVMLLAAGVSHDSHANSFLRNTIYGNSNASYFEGYIDPFSLGTSDFHNSFANQANSAFLTSPGFAAGVAALTNQAAYSTGTTIFSNPYINGTWATWGWGWQGGW